MLYEKHVILSQRYYGIIIIYVVFGFGQSVIVWILDSVDEYEDQILREVSFRFFFHEQSKVMYILYVLLKYPLLHSPF